MYKFLYLKTANDGKHKYLIKLQNITSGEIHKIKFGALHYDDYTKSQNDKKKEDYIARHSVREDWTDPTKKSTLSRYILWNKPTLKASVDDYLRRFNIVMDRFV